MPPPFTFMPIIIEGITFATIFDTQALIGFIFRCLPNEVYPVGPVSLCSISSIKP